MANAVHRPENAPEDEYWNGVSGEEDCDCDEDRLVVVFVDVFAVGVVVVDDCEGACCFEGVVVPSARDDEDGC